MVCSDWNDLESKLKHCGSIEELIQCLEDGQTLFFVISSSTSNLTDSEKLTISQSTGIQQELIFNIHPPEHSGFVAKFSCYLHILLDDIAKKWLTQISEEDKKRLYYSNFIYGPVLDCFLTILSCLKQSKHLKVMQACYDVLTQFVSVGRLQQLIVEKSLAHSNVHIESLASHLCNIPENITNKMNLLNTNDMFNKENYIVILMQNILGALERLQHQSSVKYNFVGKLLGKLAFIGDKHIVVQCLLEFVNRGHEYGDQISEVLVAVSSQHLEAITLPFFTCDYIKFEDLKVFINIVFGSKIVLIGKLCTLLYHRFIFIKFFKDVRPKYLLFYPLTMKEERRYLLTKTLFELLTVWGNKSSVDLQPYDHHYSLCEYIIICFFYIDNDERVLIKEKIMMLLTAGMPVHLGSNQPDFRKAGMVTAEILTQFLDINPESPLKFEYEETDDTLKLKSLMVGYVEPDDLVKTPPPQIIAESDSKVPENTQGLDSDDDDDELKPFNMTDKNLAAAKAPVYLNECIEILTERESDRDFDKIEITLRTLPKILATSEGNIDEISLELTQIILPMSSEFYMEDFLDCRKQILIKCCVAAPCTVADYLCYQFYEDNYTIGHRLDILDVIVKAAQELSKLDTETVDEPLSEEDRMKKMKPWEIEVMERLKKKTRVFNTATKVSIGKENKFSAVSGNFFYALMNQYDKEIRSLSLTEEDTLVLGRLIYTLGIVLHCAGPAHSGPMGKTLLEFIRVFTDIFILDEYVKQSILFATSIVAQISPVVAMTAEIYPQLMHIRLWAEELLTEPISADTTKLAVYALDIMDTVIGRGLFPSDINSLSKEYSPLSLKDTIMGASPKISEMSSDCDRMSSSAEDTESDEAQEIVDDGEDNEDGEEMDHDGADKGRSASAGEKEMEEQKSRKRKIVTLPIAGKSAPLIPAPGDSNWLDILFPGRVVNAARALSLMTSPLTADTKEVELNFRPRNPSSIPLRAEVQPTAKLILKIHKQTKAVRVVGIVRKTVTFTKMADFQLQYPPAPPTPNYCNIVTPLIDHRYMTRDKHCVRVNPHGHALQDAPFDYFYVSGDPVDPKSGAAITRQPRPSMVIHWKSTDSEIPSNPMKKIATNVFKQNFLNEYREKIEVMFRSRPIWTTMAFANNMLQCREVQLRTQLLPYFAYYANLGPWRGMWIKFGYDPRADPMNRKYQLIDFRAPKSMAAKMAIERFSVRKGQSSSMQDEMKEERESEEGATTCHIYKSDKVCYKRQNLYQVCDILDKRCQAVLKTYETDIFSHEDGFYNKGAVAAVRKIMVAQFQDLMEKRRAHDEDMT